MQRDCQSPKEAPNSGAKFLVDALEWRRADEGVGTGVLGEGHSKSGGQKTWPRKGKGKVRKEAEHTKHRGEAETGQYSNHSALTHP